MTAKILNVINEINIPCMLLFLIDLDCHYDHLV